MPNFEGQESTETADWDGTLLYRYAVIEDGTGDVTTHGWAAASGAATLKKFVTSNELDETEKVWISYSSTNINRSLAATISASLSMVKKSALLHAWNQVS